MSIIWTIVVGFFVGLFARLLMPGKDALGFIWTTLLGIGGAILGKYIGLFFGLYDKDQSAGFFMSLIGAFILLFIYHLIRKRNTNNI